ncbi:MAG: hypothetical protein ACI4QR_00915 [Eubacteriales bacterium]
MNFIFPAMALANNPAFSFKEKQAKELCLALAKALGRKIWHSASRHPSAKIRISFEKQAKELPVAIAKATAGI